ncbi:MAG: YfiR family protein [Myxococcota bacterium]
MTGSATRCALLALVLLSTPRSAAASPELAAVLVKALGYDQNLLQRSEDSVIIAVVGPAAHGPTDEMHASLSALRSMSIRKRRLRIERVQIDEKLARRLEEIGVDFIGVPEQLSQQRFGEILKASKELKVPCVTLSAENVRRGVSMGVGVVRRRPRIYVNLNAAKQQGANYSSDLLQLATRVN